MKNRALILSAVLVLLLLGKLSAQEKQAPGNIFGLRTLADGTVKADRVELPDGQKQLDVTVLLDGTKKIGQLEFPNGKKYFDTTRLPDGTQRTKRVEFPDGEKDFDTTTLPDGTTKIGRVGLPSGQKWFDVTDLRDGTKKIGRVEFPDGEKDFDTTTLPDGTSKAGRREFSNGQKQFDVTTLPDGTQKIGRIEFPDGKKRFEVTVLPDGSEKVERVGCGIAPCQTETADIMEHISSDLKAGAFSVGGDTWAEMRKNFRRKRTLILDIYAQTSRLQKVSRDDFERYNSRHITPACSQSQWEVTRPLLYAMAANFKDLMEFVERAPDMPPGPEKREQFLVLKHREEALDEAFKAQHARGPCGISRTSEQLSPDK